MPRVIQSQRVWILLRGFTRWKGSSGSLENHIRVTFENLWVWFYILLESFQNQSLKVKRRGELENRLETLGEVLFVLKPLLSAQGFLHTVEWALGRSTRSLGWSRRNSDWTILAKELELHWSASNMQPKTAFTFVLSNQKLSELPKAAVQHFLHHCCLTPAPTHPLSRVSTRSIPASPREAASLSLLPQQLLHARARGSWFSRATSELSIIRAQFAFFLSASHLSSPKLTLQLCVPLAGSLLCSSAPHLVTQSDFNLFFFFFSWMYLPLGASQQSCVLPGMSLLGQNILHDLSEVIWLFFPWAEALLATWKPTDLWLFGSGGGLLWWMFWYYSRTYAFNSKWQQSFQHSERQTVTYCC